MCIAIIYFPVFNITNFEIKKVKTLKLENYMTKKSKQKFKYFKKEKSFLMWNKKQFSSFWKSFQRPKIVSDLRLHFKPFG